MAEEQATRDTTAVASRIGAATWSDRQLIDPDIISPCQIVRVPCVQHFEKHRGGRMPYLIDYVGVLHDREALVSVTDMRVLLRAEDVTGQFLEGRAELVDRGAVGFILREAKEPTEQVVSNRHMIYCRATTTFGRRLVARQENAPLVMLITVDGRHVAHWHAERATSTAIGAG